MHDEVLPCAHQVMCNSTQLMSVPAVGTKDVLAGKT